jgi:hypothetical protein
LLLHLDGQSRAARLVQQRFQEQRCAALALTEIGHQQPAESDQPGAGLALRYTRRELRAGGFAAVAAPQAVPLIFAHVWSDFRELPNLMSQWFGIATGQVITAAAAFRRLQDVQFVAAVGRQQRPAVLRVSRLSAPLPLRLGFLLHGLGMRMLRARRQRRILRRFVEPCFQLGDLGQQQPNDNLCLRRLPGDQFLGKPKVNSTPRSCQRSRCSVWLKSVSPNIRMRRKPAERHKAIVSSNRAVTILSMLGCGRVGPTSCSMPRCRFPSLVSRFGEIDEWHLDLCKAVPHIAFGLSSGFS